MTNKKISSLYNGDVNITFYPDSHRYKLEGEKSYLVSVTACTGVIDKSRVLMGWATGLARDYFYEKIRDEQYTKDEILMMVDEAVGSYKEKQQSALSVGSFIHSWVEAFTEAKVRGEVYEGLLIPEDFTDKMKAQCDSGINAFLDWYNVNDIEYIANERLLYSKSHNYVGHCDAIIRTKDGLELLDYKTSNGIYSEYWYQVAGYVQAYEEETGEKIIKGRILRFNKENGEFDDVSITREELDAYIDTFNALVKVKKHLKKIKHF
jgi:hypothetical protein